MTLLVPALSLWPDKHNLICTVVGPMPLKLAEKSRLPLMLLQIGPSLKGLGFLLRKLRPLGLLVLERGKRSQPSS